MSSPMPLCEDLAANPARYLFRLHLQNLKAAPGYDQQRREAVMIYGYLSCLLEHDLVSQQQHSALFDEIHAFVWGPYQ